MTQIKPNTRLNKSDTVKQQQLSVLRCSSAPGCTLATALKTGFTSITRSHSCSLDSFCHFARVLRAEGFTFLG